MKTAIGKFHNLAVLKTSEVWVLCVFMSLKKTKIYLCERQKYKEGKEVTK